MGQKFHDHTLTHAQNQQKLKSSGYMIYLQDVNVHQEIATHQLVLCTQL